MLDRVLSDKRAAVVDRWLQVVIDAHSDDAAKLLRREADRFANPAGHLYSDGIPKLYDEFVRGATPAQCAPILEEMLKLRAVQDLTPSQAVGFVPALKAVIQAETGLGFGAAEWAELDARLDRLSLCAFDVYMRCRERVYEVRYNQLKKMNYTLLERANRMWGASLCGTGASGPGTGEAGGGKDRGEDR